MIRPLNPKQRLESVSLVSTSGVSACVTAAGELPGAACAYAHFRGRPMSLLDQAVAARKERLARIEARAVVDNGVDKPRRTLEAGLPISVVPPFAIPSSNPGAHERQPVMFGEAELKALQDEVAALKSDLDDLRNDLVRNHVIDSNNGHVPRQIFMIDIISAVCEHFGIGAKDVLSTRRPLSLSRPRQIIFHLGRRLTRQSFKQIGDRLGGRDHTTVIAGCNRIAALMAESGDFAAEVLRIEAKLLRVPGER